METHDSNPRPHPDGPSSEHRRAWDAIPWLVAGSVAADARRLLQRHLPDCAECRAELAFQQHVRTHLHAGTPATMPSPEAGLQRLLARLDDAETGVDGSADGVAATTAQAPRRSGAVGWTRWLVAAVVLQAVGLGGAGLALFDRTRVGSDRPDAAYRTLGTAAPRAAPASVRLVPAPGLDFAALQQLLARTRMAVVDAAPDGSSLGLAPRDGDPRTTASALPSLRADPRVLLAEPTGR